MRLDLILSGQITVTDTQLLDGAWLVSQDPALLAERLAFLDDGAPLIVVRARADTLEKAVVGFVRDHTTGLWKDFRFSAVDPATADAVSHHLKALVEGGTEPPPDLEQVTTLLLGQLTDSTPMARLLPHWSQWDQYMSETANDMIVMKPFGQDRDVSRATGEALSEGLSPEDLQSLADDDIDTPLWQREAPLTRLADACAVSPAFVEEIVTLLVDGGSRTAIYDKADAARISAYSLDSTKRFVDRVLGLAHRSQHGAVDFDDDRPMILQPVGRFLKLTQGKRASAYALRELSDSGWATEEVPSDYLARLTLLSVDDLREWYAGNAADIAKWRSESGDAAKALVRALRSLESEYLDRVTEAQLRGLLGLGHDWTLRQQLLRHYDDQSVWLRIGALVIAPISFSLTLVEGLTALAQKSTEVLFRDLSNPRILTSDVAAVRKVRND